MRKLEFRAIFGENEHTIQIGEVNGAGGNTFSIMIEVNSNWYQLAQFTKTLQFGWAIFVPRRTKRTAIDIDLQGHDLMILGDIIEGHFF